MDNRLQRQFNGLQSEQFNIEPNMRKNIAGLILYATGTNDTGQTGANENLGSCVLTRNGDQVINAKFETLADIGNINFGSNLFSSTTAGAFVSSAFVPFYAPGFESALAVRGQTELNFEYVPSSNVSTVFTDLSIRVYAVYTDTEEAYTYSILRQFESESGAVSSKNYPLNKENIESIFLKDVSDVVTAVQLTVDGENVVSPQPFEVLEIVTLIENQLEQNTTPRVKIPLSTRGVARSLRNLNSVLSLSSSGAGDFEITVCSVQ